jgi:nitrite reductase/ring-hydroxylating ferredoxin subunit
VTDDASPQGDVAGPQDGWQVALALEDLAEGRAKRVTVQDAPVLLYRSGERIFAIGARCTHQGAPLDRGPIKVGGSLATVTCPAHGSMFSLEDGSVMRGPATQPMPAYHIRVIDGNIELRT